MRFVSHKHYVSFKALWLVKRLQLAKRLQLKFMRHRNKRKILDRAKAPREAMIRNLATSLVLYEKVKTTKAKALAVRPFVERMITVGKTGTLTARRNLLRKLYIPSAVEKVLNELSPRYKGRAGGYTRITRIGFRSGDAAEVVQIEFV